MDAVCGGEIKKEMFHRLAWQMYVDAAKQAGDDYTMAGSSSSTNRPAADSAAPRAGIRAAILATHPACDAVQMAAEEFVEVVLRVEVMTGNLPVEVACPSYHAAWDTHKAEPQQLSGHVRYKHERHFVQTAS